MIDRPLLSHLVATHYTYTHQHPPTHFVQAGTTSCSYIFCLKVSTSTSWSCTISHGHLNKSRVPASSLASRPPIVFSLLHIVAPVPPSLLPSSTHHTPCRTSIPWRTSPDVTPILSLTFGKLMSPSMPFPCANNAFTDRLPQGSTTILLFFAAMITKHQGSS